MLAAAGPARAGVVRLTTANAPPNATADHTGLCDRVMTEAFRRLGLRLEIVNLPSERSLLSANEGIHDGNFARVQGLEKQYPNLIRVAEQITTFEFVAFTAGPVFRTAGWESLRPHHVGIVTGWKILEGNITGGASLTKVRDEKLLFGLLAAGRADLVVYDRQQGRVVLEQLGLRGITVLEPPLAVEGMYPYLHKRHAALVPRLERVLREMKQDGTYRKIAAEALRPFAGARAD
jgi:polar amino acid transport system substrate-binding protein